MKTKTEERVELMRRGERLKCPRCSEGFFSAIGDPKTTLVFGCNKCEAGMVLTVPIDVQRK